MNNQEQLRAILGDIRVSRGLSWREAKLYACGLSKAAPVSPVTMDTWLSTDRTIPDKNVRLLFLEWWIDKNNLIPSLS